MNVPMYIISTEFEKPVMVQAMVKGINISCRESFRPIKSMSMPPKTDPIGLGRIVNVAGTHAGQKHFELNTVYESCKVILRK